VRFTPFFPFSLDTACGAYLHPGVSLLQMQCLWVVFAVSCWFPAYLVTRSFRHRAAA
jgi:hypothetical protein